MNSEREHIDCATIPEGLRPVLSALSAVAAEVNEMIAIGPLGDALGAAVGENTDGDQQKALDVLADNMFASALRPAKVRFYASEERDTVDTLNQAGSYAIAIDPLDGSSNIDTNVSIGTIFSIYDAGENADASFLRPVSEQIAGGYFIYGPQCALIVTFGDGVQHFVLDPRDRTFHLAEARMEIPALASEFAINASNYRHWSQPIRAYIDDCIAGEEGPRAKNFNMRWIASLVAETHRIMARGGIFLYPSDDRPGYEHGRLRLLYEGAPIAFLAEQAGGAATDGCDRILDKTVTELHKRAPLVFGTVEKVERVASYHDLPEVEVSALFGNRGLFRA
ncbi:MAG: class 1 fructose-bisphosphatase [Paracoccaceae bacterium]|nr:class 1 fructose-bisphosphatase [Paracoccaceae bacterium]